VQVNYVMRMTGFHEFAEFVSEDVGTIDSGLNSMVLASNSEAVLLPVNEPTFGTKRKSQVQGHKRRPGPQEDPIIHTQRLSLPLPRL
jgi:4-hydroxyphenylpyruvate dioxygenase